MMTKQEILETGIKIRDREIKELKEELASYKEEEKTGSGINSLARFIDIQGLKGLTVNID